MSIQHKGLLQINKNDNPTEKKQNP
jgi:hypothetical protein